MRPRLARRGGHAKGRLERTFMPWLQCGPGSLAGEDAVTLDADLSNVTGFNAAPARSPGRTTASTGDNLKILKLQCGPGSLAGEDSATMISRVTGTMASIRPPPARPGGQRPRHRP